MASEFAEDRLLEEALARQRQLIDFYKQAAKDTTDKRCKAMFKHFAGHLEEEVGDASKELARHRMERRLGHPIDHP